MTTPLPNASPSALTTTGKSQFFAYSSAPSKSSKALYAAVGMPCLAINSLAKALLASNIAAFLTGPKALTPLSVRKSTSPPASGSSGATNTKSTPFLIQKSKIPSKSIGETGAQVAHSAIPAFPGRQNNLSSNGLSFSLRANACSLPPPPIIATFIFFILYPSMLEMSQTGEHHGYAVLVRL